MATDTQVARDTRQIRMPSTMLRSRADLRWDGEPVTVSVWEGLIASNGGM